MLNVPSIVFLGIDVVKFAVNLGTAYMLFLAVSLTLNLEAGYTGVPNFGKVMFLAGGAVVSASFCGQLAVFILGINVHGDYNVYIVTVINQVNASLSQNPVLCVELIILGTLLAAGVGAIMGYLASYPAIRLREDYLGMLLLASAQFFQIFLRSYPPVIGGVQGIEVPDFFGGANPGPGARDIIILGVVSVFAVSVYIYCERVARSPLGRTLRAIRDNEVASRALGKDDVAIRKRVIVVASAISGIAGALLTFYVESVGPDTWSRQDWTFPFWVIIILGGAANNSGVAIGAFTYAFILKTTDKAKFLLQGILPSTTFNYLQYLTFASLLVLVLALRPEGIFPEKPSLTLKRQTVATIIETKAKGPD